MSEHYHFQVNLGGMLDLLSNHLYKSPDVFLRELLQNGVDAITLRAKEQPGWYDGRITIRVNPGQSLHFQDNGAGLNEEGIHRFLAVIGQSSKTELINGKLPEDYIGRFGIGLLSCFMVSDSIRIHTRPAQGGSAHVWTGLPDGTYTLEPLENCPVGTEVILTAKPGMEHYFQAKKIAELVQYYGLALPVPIYLDNHTTQLNNIPSNFSEINRNQLLAFGEWLFQEEFLDAIPIQTPHISGVAYVLPSRTAPSVHQGHRIYLKQMLLTEQGETLLPSWAFFLRCFLNTHGLRPTASREDFYEDDALTAAKDEFAAAIRTHLITLSRNHPQRLHDIVAVHTQAIKSMAIWDETLFHLFIDYLSFQTSEGTMTGAALKQVGEAYWVFETSKFQQLKPIFRAQGRLLICTGYEHDQELISLMTNLFHLPFQPLLEDSLFKILEDASPDEEQQAAVMLRCFNQALRPFDCQAQLRRFLPVDLPALYTLSEKVQFLRKIESVQENGASFFSGALASLLSSAEERPMSCLYLNENSTLIQRLIHLNQPEILSNMAQVLYVQALLAGGYPLRHGEQKIMNQALLSLLENTTDTI